MPLTEGDLKKFGFDEIEDSEEFRQSRIKTGYPTPARRYRIHYEGYNISIEEPYFWTLHYLRYFGGFPRIDKITDVFAAAENSAFFGASQQRLGLQQDKVSQFLATIGKMVRELFQLVREMRILDERLSYYSDSYTNSPSAESAEITLKGIWVDLVEQGAKNPASVYGMAREVQFTTLPDLFFSTHPKKQEDVDIVVEKERGQFNRKVREVLKRKLRSFLAWKEHTYEELKNRRKFTLKYLRQHFEIIRMYMTWVKPYLKNIQRMQLDQSRVDTPDLIVAFESSMIEVEILAIKGKDAIKQCILMHYLFRTRPEMSYSQEYQRGPLHLGRVEMDFRAYAWTDAEIDNYKKMREHEDMQLLGVIDGSVRAALEALGDELMRYLKEAGEEFVEKKEMPKPPAKQAGPFLSVFQGFAELFGSFRAKKTPALKKPSQTDLMKEAIARSKAEDSVKKVMWNTYHHFKKQHDMLNW
ncbi:hypothetical protein HYX02_05470 [Candidatus Woesearchaeota archaeon]|nr:hypothetical protein [Candidatus Woesearchaeota archaeon]